MLAFSEPLPEWLVLVLVALVGLIFGSFVTLASYRLPRDEPIGAGRSRCPHCGTPLGFRALFPLFSWIAQKGRCHYCKTPISARYPIIELTQAILFLLVYLTLGISWAGLVVALLSVALLVMIVVDFEWYIIPDEIQITCTVLAIIYHWIAGTPFMSVFTGAAMGLSIGVALRYGYSFLRHKEGLGMGDVKFLIVAGLWMADALSWAPFLFYAGIWGVVTALGWRMLGKGAHFPFGPALAASLLMMLLTPSGTLFFWTINRLYA